MHSGHNTDPIGHMLYDSLKHLCSSLVPDPWSIYRVKNGIASASITCNIIYAILTNILRNSYKIKNKIKKPKHVTSPKSIKVSIKIT